MKGTLMTTTTSESNMQRAAREHREAQAQLMAESAKNPQFSAMAEAMRVTAKEQARIDAAQEAVAEAEAVVGAAGMTLLRAKRGIPPTHDTKEPFSFFKRSMNSHKAARAALPSLEIDLREARDLLTNAIRRRNNVAREIEVARMERRRAAKAKHAPQPMPVASRGDGWVALARPGGKGAR